VVVLLASSSKEHKILQIQQCGFFVAVVGLFVGESRKELAEKWSQREFILELG
jgi:hypothetical protein